MRVILGICLLAVLTTSCSSRVALQTGGKLSVAERRSVVAIHPDFANWEPSQNASWSRHGVVRHVCLKCGGIGSLTMPYWGIVFDGDGNIVEANIIQAPNPGEAEAIISASPLRVAFKANNGKIYVCGGEFSETAWLQDIRKEMDLERRLHETVETWQRSGGTNWAELDHMIKEAIANSRR